MYCAFIDDVAPWMIWGYYISPMMYGQPALVLNEFLDKRWSIPNTDPRINEPTIGRVILASKGYFKEEYLYWIGIGALLGYAVVFNILYIVALTYLNPFNDSKTIVQDDDETEKNMKTSLGNKEHNKGIEMDTLSNQTILLIQLLLHLNKE